MKLYGVGGIAYYGMTWSKYDKVFRNLGLGIGYAYPIFKYKKKSDYSTTYMFTLPCGLCLKDFDDNKDAIEQYIGKTIDIKYTYKEIQIEEYVQHAISKFQYEPTKIEGNVPIMIGHNRRGELVSCDLSTGEPHMGVYGETGSGKSTAMRSIITNLILMSNVDLHLVDLKNGAEFKIFHKSKKVISFCRTIKETEILLMQISVEVDRRYDLFYEKDVKDIGAYNKKYKNNKMNYQVVVIDEFADLPLKSPSMLTLKEIARKSRACGIHLLIATQRPSSKVLEGDIKQNVSCVLGLKANDATSSQVMIDSSGLEKLRGEGHGIFKRGNKTEIQAPFLDPDRCEELIRSTNINKTTKKEDIVFNGSLNDSIMEEALAKL
jgi:S-DNA-T family DNA segregation ATPase FtsK/SpoIIIE